MKYVRKGQYGFPVITISPKEYLDKSAEVLLKAIEPVGKAITKFVAAPQHGATSYATTGQYKTKEKAKELKLKEKAFEEHVSPALSPSNHVVAWTQGSWDPRVGLRKIAEWGPLALLASLGVDAIGFKYAPKVVKGTPKAVVDVAAKAGNKTAKKAVVVREINKASKNGIKEKIDLLEQLKNNTRTKVGDIEINNPELAYRLVGKGAVENFLKTGELFVPVKLTGNKLIDALNNMMGGTPMYKQGSLWYGLDPLYHPELFTTTEPLAIGNKHANIVKPWIDPGKVIKKGIRTGEVDYAGKANLLWGRRVPFTENLLNLSNVTSYKWVPGYGYKKVIQEPSTSLAFFERKPSKISEAERAGVPKGERFTSKWHVANYPGYLLKGLMKGSLLEKQLSKNGTININLLNAYFNKASQLERNVANKVLAEKFSGLKTIDYNLFKKAVLNELISYSRKPQTRYSVYGMDRLGFKIKRETDGAGGLLEYTPGIKTNTFSFESSNIPTGNARHYDSSTLGHSRTYTTPDEPNILHVMESLSDWGQSRFFEDIPRYLTNELEYIHMNNAFKRLLRRVPLQFKEEYNRLILDFLTYRGEFPDNIRNSYSEEFKDFVEDLLNPYAPYPNGDAIQRWNRMYNYNPNSLYKYLHDNYLQRLLQENLKYAAENGLTKMRYPTSETAAKIEGYTPKLQWYSPTGERLDMRNLEFDTEIGDFEYPKGSIMKNEYSPQHLTILKKYADFPKMFLKLFRGHPVEIVTDSKGNTWYLVNVPKGYLSREWQYKKGGKTHKPFGHRSILDNGWQSTKLLKNKKNVYGK